MIAAFGVGVIAGFLAAVGVWTVMDIMRKHYDQRCEEELNEGREVIEDRHRACEHNLRNIEFFDEEEF